ncbi:MAG: CobW family GTP-binding protein, partial [Thiohalospira sp.]
MIAGPLGAGKTTTIRHLLARRPSEERWAVLVNEFGEAGIDGAALVDASDDLAEVPGGCICCTARTQLRVTLTRLLRRVRPHRLLIEPTGLGHPAGIIDMLREPGLAEAIDLQSVIAVFPADGLTEDRLAAAPPVRDAFELADVLVLNKADRADPATLAAARELAASAWPPKAGVVVTEQGELDPAWLDAPARAASAAGGAAVCELE